MKRMLSLILTLVMMLACSGIAMAEGLEPVTLKMWFIGCTVNDDTAVMEVANAYLTEKLNVTLQPIWGTWGDYDPAIVNALNVGDDIDIYMTNSWMPNEYNTYARKGMYLKLDDLIKEYAQEAWDALPEVLRVGATIEGAMGYGVYAMPVYKDIATQNCWDINVDLLEKYGYSLDDIRSRDYYSFGDILETVKKGEGDAFYPLLVEGMVLERMVTNSIMVAGDSGAVNLLSYYLDPVDPAKDLGNKMVNKFGTEEYKKFVEKTREYYLAGYIDPAMANADQANEARTNAQLEGRYLIGTQSYSLGYEAETSAIRGIHVEYVPCTPAYVDTTSSQGALYAISTVSKNPERAMMFLNLLYTDPYLCTLLTYGIEGVHYTTNENGTITFTEERANFMPWRNGMGNIVILPPQEGEGPDFWKVFGDYYGGASLIPILGFTFDNTPVQTEMAALANVASEYALALNTGAADPAEKLPEFLAKLEAAGIQKYVDEANAQLDDFMANKNS